MAELRENRVEAACNTSGTSWPKAKLFVRGVFLWLGMKILQTWFAWAGAIADLLVLFGLLLMAKYVLRAWSRLCNHTPTPGPVAPRSAAGRSAPQSPATPCADAQGRLERDDLGGHDVSAMAETILRQAAVREPRGR